MLFKMFTASKSNPDKIWRQVRNILRITGLPEEPSKWNAEKTLNLINELCFAASRLYRVNPETART